MIPITCSLVEPAVGAVNILLAAITQFLGPFGLATILNPISNLVGWVRGVAGCP